MLKLLENIPSNDPVASPEKRQLIDNILKENKDRPGGLMVVLNEIQNQIGFISIPMQRYVAYRMKIPVSTVHGVVSFYSFFTTSPRGQHTIKFCLGTACYVGGAPQLIEKAKQLLGIAPGQTTENGEISLEICRCVGACSQAPVVVVDEDTYGKMRPNKFPQLIRAVQEKSKTSTGQKA